MPERIRDPGEIMEQFLTRVMAVRRAYPIPEPIVKEVVKEIIIEKPIKPKRYQITWDDIDMEDEFLEAIWNDGVACGAGWGILPKFIAM